MIKHIKRWIRQHRRARYIELNEVFITSHELLRSEDDPLKRAALRKTATRAHRKMRIMSRHILGR